MATSNSVSYNLNTLQVITRALQVAGVVASEEVVQGSDYSLALDLLNMMIKNWEADGVDLWKYTEATLFISQGVGQYALGNGARAVATSNTFITTSSATANQGATTITLASVTGMSINDVIGVVLSTGLTQWTTIDNINSLTVTLHNALTSSATNGTSVYTYTPSDVISRPFDVMRARYVMNIASSTPIVRPLEMKARTDFYNLPSPTTQSVPTVFYYDTQLLYSNLNIWMTPSVETDVVQFTYKQRLQDLINATDNIDFPQEWIYPIVMNLALLIAAIPAYGLSSTINPVFAQLAQQCYATAKSLARDMGPSYVVPDLRESYR